MMSTDQDSYDVEIEEVTEEEGDPEPAFGASSVERSSVSQGASQYNSTRNSSTTSRQSTTESQDSPLLASTQQRSSMQQAPPRNQSELIARSMQQNRPPSQQYTMNSFGQPQMSGAGGTSAQASMGSAGRPSAQSTASRQASMGSAGRPSAQYTESRQASMGSAGRPSSQYTASRQASMGSAGRPSGAGDMTNSRSGYEPQPKEGVDPATASMRHWVIIFGLLILICVGAAAIVVPLYVTPQFETEPTILVITPSPNTAPPVPNKNPTASPTAKNSIKETLPPTTADFGTFVKDFATAVSGSAVFKDPTSPQYKAVDFIANDADYTSTITDDAMMGDFYAVAVFYYSTGGDNWYECSQGSDSCPDGVSWMTSNVTYCDWNWISCNEVGRVVDILFVDVQGNNLTGTLTSELALLTELEQFATLNDSIEGTLPDKLGDLTHVTHFLLANNSISGKFPDTFLENSPVEVFMVSDNKFNGNIPASLSKMSSIYQMFLDNNRFSGPIPEEFGSLPYLATLDLTGNTLLNGEIPDSIFSISMQNLYLGGTTGIVGSLSSAVGQATNLVRLHITGTRISGGIPDELFALPFLTEVVLSNNTLTGELSESVADLGGTLQMLMLDGNKFSGDLPNVAIDDLAISNILAFDRNSFTGAISPSTCRRKGDGFNELQILTVDCKEVTCSCCNNCSPS